MSTVASRSMTTMLVVDWNPSSVMAISWNFGCRCLWFGLVSKSSCSVLDQSWDDCRFEEDQDWVYCDWSRDYQVYSSELVAWCRFVHNCSIVHFCFVRWFSNLLHFLPIFRLWEDHSLFARTSVSVRRRSYTHIASLLVWQDYLDLFFSSSHWGSMKICPSRRIDNCNSDSHL